MQIRLRLTHIKVGVKLNRINLDEKDLNKYEITAFINLLHVKDGECLGAGHIVKTLVR